MSVAEKVNIIFTSNSQSAVVGLMGICREVVCGK
jgi:hypothetical protein